MGNTCKSMADSCQCMINGGFYTANFSLNVVILIPRGIYVYMCV